MDNRYKGELKLRIKNYDIRNKELKTRLSLIFLLTGFFMSLLGGIVTAIYMLNFFLILPSLIMALVCLLVPMFSDNIVKTTEQILFIVGLLYFPFIFSIAGGVNGPAPMYFILVVIYMAFFYEGKKIIYVNVFLMFFYISIIVLSIMHPQYIVHRDNEFFRTIDISVAVISVSIVISIVANATFRGYKNEHNKTVALMKELETQNDKLKELSIMDQLTGVYNRRHFMDVLDSEITHFKKYKQNFHVMMIDLDGFKQVNDNNGHLFGDEVLRKVAQQIKKTTRDYDVIARYGGEEFCVLVSHLNPEDSITIAERIRLHVENLELRNDVHMTVSIGVATYIENDTSEMILRRADESMYEAKARGKNLVADKESE